MKLAPFNLFFSGLKRSQDRVRRNATSKFTTATRTVRRSAVLFWILFPGRAYSQVYNGGGVQGGITTAGTQLGTAGIQTTTDLTGLLLAVISFILNFVLILSVLSIIIAGFYLITSGGEEGQKEKAKKIIFYALIGIIVVLLARVIVVTVNNLF